MAFFVLQLHGIRTVAKEVALECSYSVLYTWHSAAVRSKVNNIWKCVYIERDTPYHTAKD